MNKTIRSILLPFVACFALVCVVATIPAKASQPVATLASPVLAQIAPASDVQPAVAPAPSPEIAEAVEDFLPGFLAGLVQKFPWLASVIVFMGTMRMWAKPVFTGIHALVALTPTKTDDGIWDKFTRFLQSPAGAWMHWLLDYVCSIKLVPPPKAKESA